MEGHQTTNSFSDNGVAPFVPVLGTIALALHYLRYCIC